MIFKWLKNTFKAKQVYTNTVGETPIIDNLPPPKTITYHSAQIISVKQVEGPIYLIHSTVEIHHGGVLKWIEEDNREIDITKVELDTASAVNIFVNKCHDTYHSPGYNGRTLISFLDLDCDIGLIAINPYGYVWVRGAGFFYRVCNAIIEGKRLPSPKWTLHINGHTASDISGAGQPLIIPPGEQYWVTSKDGVDVSFMIESQDPDDFNKHTTKTVVVPVGTIMTNLKDRAIRVSVVEVH